MPVRQAGFHLLVKIKDEEEIDFIQLKNKSLSGHKATDRIGINEAETLSVVENPDSGSMHKKHKPSTQFSHLFNSYSQAFNKKHKRTGSLFERPFHRIEITNEVYLKYLVYYIHHNPVHHGFTEDMNEYPWSSYLTILSSNKTRLKRQEVIEWFDDKENFNYFHKQQHELDKINQLLIDN